MFLIKLGKDSKNSSESDIKSWVVINILFSPAAVTRHPPEENFRNNKTSNSQPFLYLPQQIGGI